MGAEQTIQSIELTQNYNTVKENIRKACEKAGRSEREVTLLAVSKTKPGGHAYGCLPCGCQGLRRE